MTRIGIAALICLALVVGSIVATPVFVSEANMPPIEKSPTATGDSWNVSVNGRFANGPSLAVDVRNDTAYSGNGAVFEIVDFENVSPPALLGRVTLPAAIKAIKVVDNYAYVANNGDGLRVIDISDPTAPTEVGAYEVSNYSLGVDVVGSTLYLANSWDGLRIFDVSTPSSPSEISHRTIACEARDVKVVGDYAYIAGGTNGLFIINISDPSTPTEVGSYDTSGNYYKIEVVGDFAFMAAYTYDLEIVDIENPAAPSKLTHLSVNGSAVSLCVDGDYAYVGSDGITVVDISEPELPFVVGSLAQPPVSNDIVIFGSRAYIAADYGGVVAYNVAAPTSPSIVLTHDTSGDAVGVTAAMGVTTSAPGPAVSDYMYIAELNDGIRIVDITNPANPTSVGQYVSSSNRAEAVAAAGNILCTAWTDGFRTIDIENPATPTQMGFYNTNASLGVAINGNYAYVAAKGYGLYVIDITNPEFPAEAGVYDTPGTAYDVVYSGGYAYVADNNSGLSIIDVSTPTAPSLVGAYTAPNSAYGVAVTGNYAYVTSFSNTVYVLDVSTPSALVEIATIVPGGNIRDVFISGNYLYVAKALSGVDVFYINDKVNSPHVGRFDTGSTAYDIFAIGHSVYVADFEDGVWMLEFDPPPTPTFISAFFCEPVDDGVELSWEILSDDVVKGFKIYRGDGSGGNGRVVNSGGLIPPNADRFVDASTQAGETYQYRLAVVLDDGSEILSIPQTVTIRDIELTLEPNYPNPFNPTTTITFVLSSNGPVNVSVYTADGKLVQTIVDGPMSAGQKSFAWDGKDMNGIPVSSGVYFCRLKTGNRTLTQKMTLIK